jgi:phage terminase small subunit
MAQDKRIRKRQLREERFCREYITDLNGTRAAIRAGYSAKTARTKGAQLLAKVSVQAILAELRKRETEKLDLNAEKVLRELALMGFSNMLDYMQVQSDGTAYVDLSRVTRDQAAAIQELVTEEYQSEGNDEEEPRVVTKVKFKLADKKGALELLGKHLKLFGDEQPHLTVLQSPPQYQIIFINKFVGPDGKEQLLPLPQIECNPFPEEKQSSST